MKETKLMPEIAIMIEGQNGLNWSRWERLMLQWLDLDDIPGLEALADAIIPNMV